MDSSFGAGKTSLAYKFRSLLGKWDQKPPGYENLEAAKYLLVECKEDKRLHDLLDLENVHIIDHCIVERVEEALLMSSECCMPLLKKESFLLFVTSLGNVAGKTKFIFHFDEIGCYETFHTSLATQIIERIWHLNHALRDEGHYCILTGRSRLLHRIGNLLSTNERDPFSSPERVIVIPLSLLSRTSMKLIFSSLNEEQINDLIAYTGGVPRAVVMLVNELKRKVSIEHA